MSNVKTLQRSFAGGIIAPELYGRVDLTKFQTGLADAQNFIILPHGPAANRPGFEYIGPVKTANKAVRLIPFTYNTEQTYVLEFGDQYIRFFTQGAQLLAGAVDAWLTATAYAVGDIKSNAGTNYYCAVAHTSGVFATDLAANKWVALTDDIVEVPSPYVEADLFDIHFVQSADVLTLVHPSYAPRTLNRLGAANWALNTISFAPSISAPANLAVTESPASGSVVETYVVTAVAEDGLEESVASSSDTGTNDLSTAGNKNSLAWDAVTGAVRYKVYKKKNGGIYGFIGESDSTAFVDDNIDPDTSIVPPESQDPFTGSNNYPAAVSYFEQRKVFGGTNNKPQNLWFTGSATESNLNYSIPTQDSDAITLRIAAREANSIRHLVPLSDLMVLTSGGEWKCSSGSGDALTPTTVQIKPANYMGANNVQPVVTGNSILYAQDRGAHVREVTFSWEAQSYKSLDASIMAPHLFDGYTIDDMAYMRSPFQVLWCVRSDGVLLGMTYVPDQQVIAWHRHEIDGTVESVCVIAEGTEDVLYVVANRTINGSQVRFIERLHSRQFDTLADAFFVDCGLTYDGAPATSISGLDHLEGEDVAVLADGAVVGSLTVTSGAITLPASASVVHVGLPITAQLDTLPLALEAQAAGQGMVKNVNAANLRVYRSSSILAGPSTDRLVEHKQRTSEPYGSPPSLVSDEIEIVLPAAWSSGGQLVVQHTAPLPITVSSMALDVAVGG